MAGRSGSKLSGATYVLRRQLYTVHQNFEACDASGGKVMSAHGNGLRVMDKIELADATGEPVLELRERPGEHPKVIVMSKGKKLLSVGEAGSDSETTSLSTLRSVRSSRSSGKRGARHIRS